MGAGLATMLCACRSAAPRGPAGASPASAEQASRATPSLTPQPAGRLADANGIAVLALGAPQFANLTREQRLVAYFASQALSAGDPIAAEQGYRHNLTVIRLLRGILGRPQAVPPPLLARIRAFARVVYLNHGLHDAQTGRKQRPPFSAAELRMAALAAAAAGADLGLSGSVEYGLRALEGPLFDPQVDAQRTVHGADLTASAVNFYEGVSLRDLESFQERAPLSSRLVKQGGVVSERVYRIPAAADALDRALPSTAPPQRPVFEALAAFFRSGDGAQLETARHAWTEALGPVDAFAGFVDRSADPRGRKALFGGIVGIADPERGAVLERVRLRNAGEALFLVAAGGVLRPPLRHALTLETKSALFGGALDAEGPLRSDAVIAALAEPSLARDLLRCAPSLRFAQLVLRELSRPPSELPALDEALAQAGALTVADDARDLFPDSRCRELWPQFVATQWLASAAASDGERIEDDAHRTVQLQIWWFTGKNAVVERHTGGRRYLTVPDGSRFRRAARDLLELLQQIDKSQDAARWRDLLDRNASRVDPQWRDEVTSRLQGIPRRVAVLPPRLDPVLDAQGNVTDAQAVQVTDLDQQMLRDWSAY
jgi:dipeptidyl-peptidase III